MKSFSDILNASPETLEASAPLPAGDYEMEVMKVDFQEMKFDFGDHKEGDQCLMFFAKPVAAIDVDEEELEACEDWRSKIVSIRMFPEELGDKFCDMKSETGFAFDCGLNPADFPTIEELIVGTQGQHFLGTITHAPNKKDPEKPYVNLNQTAAL